MKIVLTSADIRSWLPGDAPSLARHANDREVWRNLRDAFPHPYQETDATAWIEFARHARPETHFAIAVDGQAVGGIGFTIKDDVFKRSAEVGYWLGRAHWRRGIATEAVRALCDYAFAQHDLCRLYATVMAWAPTSARVLEKAGFVFEGRLRQAVTKDGQTIDDLLYALVKKP